MSEKDEVLLKCYRTVENFQRIIDALRRIDNETVNTAVGAIDIDFENIKAQILNVTDLPGQS